MVFRGSVGSQLQAVGRIGGPRKDCQEAPKVSVNQVGRIGGPKRTARCVFREEVLRVSFKQVGWVGGPRRTAR